MREQAIGADKERIASDLAEVDDQLRAVEEINARLQADMRHSQQRVLVAEQMARSEAATAHVPLVSEQFLPARVVSMAEAIGRDEGRAPRERTHRHVHSFLAIFFLLLAHFSFL